MLVINVSCSNTTRHPFQQTHYEWRCIGIRITIAGRSAIDMPPLIGCIAHGPAKADSSKSDTDASRRLRTSLRESIEHGQVNSRRYASACYGDRSTLLHRPPHFWAPADSCAGQRPVPKCRCPDIADILWPILSSISFGSDPNCLCRWIQEITANYLWRQNFGWAMIANLFHGHCYGNSRRLLYRLIADQRI